MWSKIDQIGLKSKILVNFCLILFVIELTIIMPCFADCENGDQRMEILSIRQTAEKLSISKRRKQILCSQSHIIGAIKIDSSG
jgi:hypothetical protein